MRNDALVQIVGTVENQSLKRHAAMTLPLIALPQTHVVVANVSIAILFRAEKPPKNQEMSRSRYCYCISYVNE